MFGSQNAVVSRDGLTLYLLGAVEAHPSDKTVPATMLPIEASAGSQKAPYELRIVTIDLARLEA